MAASSLFANWGSGAGGSVATGSFHSFGTGQVEMRRENLVIRLYRDRANVEIDYILHNSGPAIDVKAGFPSLGVKLEDVAHHEIEDYAIFADERAVPFTVETGDPAPFKSLYEAKFRRMGEMDEYPPDKRPELLEWLASTVHFDAGQSRHIHIQYESLYAYCFGGYSDDSDTCDDRFAYVLSTAAAWKGPIGDGKVTIEAVTVDPDRIMISPAKPFQRSGKTFTWGFHKLKPTDADNILVSMGNHSSSIADYDENDPPAGQEDFSYYVFKAGRYFYLHRFFTAHSEPAASEPTAPKVRKPVDDFGWRSVNSPGIGESITLTLTKHKAVDQLVS